MLALFAKLSVKAVASFLLMVTFFVFCAVMQPGILTRLQEWSEYLEALVYSPPFLTEQQKIFWRLVVNAGTILGAFLTLASRFIVEIIVYLFANTLEARREKTTKAKADSVASEAKSIKYD